MPVSQIGWVILMWNSAHRVDLMAYVWMSQFRHQPFVTPFFKAISHSGDGYLYGAIAFTAWYASTVHALLFLKVALFAFLIEIPVFICLKKMIQRERPFVSLANCEAAITPSDKFSMPSGHSAAAFLFAFLIAEFFPGLCVLGYLWATAVAASRLVLGVHYPSDVIVGAILGISCSCLSILIVN